MENDSEIATAQRHSLKNVACLSIEVMHRFTSAANSHSLFLSFHIHFDIEACPKLSNFQKKYCQFWKLPLRSGITFAGLSCKVIHSPRLTIIFILIWITYSTVASTEESRASACSLLHETLLQGRALAWAANGSFEKRPELWWPSRILISIPMTILNLIFSRTDCKDQMVCFHN